MRRLSWLITRTIEKIGITGWLVILMSIVVVSYACLQLLPLQQQLADIEAQPKPTSTVKTNVVIAEQHSLPVLDQMPSALTLTERLQTFFTIVEDFDLTINEVSYSEQHKKGEEVMRYQLTFVVEEQYPTIKEFVLTALAAMPYLALDAIAFERESIKQSRVVTKLRFTLYMVQS